MDMQSEGRGAYLEQFNFFLSLRLTNVRVTNGGISRWHVLRQIWLNQTLSERAVVVWSDGEEQGPKNQMTRMDQGQDRSRSIDKVSSNFSLIQRTSTF